MTMPSITYNGKNSYQDFKLILTSFEPQPPSRKRIKKEIATMNGALDYSTIGTGSMTYDERDIKVGFTMVADNKSLLHAYLSAAIQWLLDGPRTNIDYKDPNRTIRFTGRVQKAPSWKESQGIGNFEVTFTADPDMEVI